MDKRRLMEMCEEGQEMALEALLEANSEIVEGGRLEGQDLFDLKCIWSAIEKIKCVEQMERGGMSRMR